MATSPTVLVGSSPVQTPSSVSEPSKFPLVPLLIAVVVGVLIAALVVGGLVYYFSRSGRLPLQASTTAKVEPAVPVATHVIVLEPMLVNLADEGGNSYLRLSLTLRVADATDKKATKAKEEKPKEDATSDVVAAVRDTTLTVLGQQTADGLLAADGKSQLKAELKSALTKHNSDLKVTDVFFTDFLVQR
jgi:flagellar FliL protein